MHWPGRFGVRGASAKPPHGASGLAACSSNASRRRFWRTWAWRRISPAASRCVTFTAARTALISTSSPTAPRAVSAPLPHFGSRGRCRSFGGPTRASWSRRLFFRKATGGRASGWHWAPVAQCSWYSASHWPMSSQRPRCSMMANSSCRPSRAPSLKCGSRRLLTVCPTARTRRGTCGRRCSRKWTLANAASKCHPWQKPMTRHHRPSRRWW